MSIEIYQILLAVVPAAIVAAVAFFSMKSMLKNELLKQKYELLKANQAELMPLKLQAFERLTLLLDRINTNKLLVRVAPIGDDVITYKNLLIATIDQEFEHNITQQMYVSEACWQAINTSKNTVISQLHSLVEAEEVKDANSYRNLGLVKFTTGNSPTHVAQAFIRSEIKGIF